MNNKFNRILDRLATAVAVMLFALAAAAICANFSGCRTDTQGDGAARWDTTYAGERPKIPDSMIYIPFENYIPARSSVVVAAFPDGAAAKVAAVLAENDITLPQVAAYLAAYNRAVVPGPLPDIEWPPSVPGTYPITHYVALLAVGVGGTTLPYYLPNAVGSKAALVAAVDDHGNISRISLAGWDDTNPANALPGLQRFVAALDGRTIEEVEAP